MVEIEEINLRGKLLRVGEMFCFVDRKKLNPEQAKIQDFLRDQMGEGPFLLSSIKCNPRGGFPLHLLSFKKEDGNEIGASSEFFEKYE